MRRKRGSFIDDAVGRHLTRIPDAFNLSRLSALHDLQRLVRSLEDRRRFDPRGAHKPPSSLTRAARKLVVDPGGDRYKWVTHGLKFAVPREVSICVRRKERKEVLHALKKTGKGGSRAPRKRNNWSSVKC